MPDNVENDDELMLYFKDWNTYAPGTYRTYTNLGVGMLGSILLLRRPWAKIRPAMEQRLFLALGIKEQLYQRSRARIADYAQGYTKQDAPIRIATGAVPLKLRHQDNGPRQCSAS